MIIGADIFGRIILDGLKFGPIGSPIAQKTIFGWILSGEIESQTKREVTIASYHCQLTLDEQLKKFWELEEIQPTKHLTKEEQECEEHYEETTTRGEDGRYVISLPFRDHVAPTMGQSRNIAISRLRNLESSFSKSTKLRDEYSRSMQEYLDLRHMKEVSLPTNREINYSHGLVSCAFNYLPHHAVFKDSATTKLRVVFDASAKTVGGPSLNDVLLTGPTLQDDLLSIILRWRKHTVVLTADIEKMYRQIWVKDEDAEYQRILWRNTPQEPIRDFKLKTVTFGTTSAPYLAVRTIQQLARDEQMNYPMAARIIQSDFYVDDLLTGCKDVETALELQKQLINLLKAGGFNLRKWASNQREVLDCLPTKQEIGEFHSLNFDDSLKTLGIKWCPKSDSFSYNISANLNDETSVTKRQFLSDISKLFDPLGFLSPVTIKTKILMQSIWQSGVNWDDEIPNDTLNTWKLIRKTIKEVEKIKIPRWIFTRDNSAEIHGFCDGSLHAYAAVLYVREVDIDGNVKVTLLASKTRVTPNKPISAPRSELCGAVLLTRLFQTVKTAMNFEKILFRAWSDSTIVLSWIRSHPGKFKTFVANRIAEIQETIDPSNWSYVPTGSNPADCATRGLLPNEILSHAIWWNGPDWLSKPEEHWPATPAVKENNLEVKKVKIHIAARENVSYLHQLINKYSALHKLIRVTSYCFRFINRCKSKTRTFGDLRNTTNWLTSTELNESIRFWIKFTQADQFEEEIKSLRKNQLPAKIGNLSPFFDNDGILRVGGRLQNSFLTWQEQHPVILPSQHHFTHLIIDDMHRRTLHGGAQLILSLLRRKYWILRARNTIRLRIHKCLVCFKQRAKCGQQLMGNLPSPRITMSRPFTHVGIDYCGPFDIKISKLRNAKKVKCYMAIFICLAVKAIHIEVVSELSTQAFLAAFKRFISRRGMCSDVYSDNATNFLGAKNVLDEYQQHVRNLNKEIPPLIETRGINWHFIPPSAPHFGGLWESGVKSAKFHLKRVITNTSLTFEELATVSSQIEACLNSRPICPISNDPSDTSALTPGHFLVGEPLLAIPEPSYLNQHIHQLDRWHYVQSLVQHFWKRWRMEYLSQLQQRPKWQKVTQNLKKGDLVLIKEDKSPSCNWPLGRIIDVHPGADNMVRVVTVQTKNATYKRPVTRVCLLPIEHVTQSINEEKITH